MSRWQPSILGIALVLAVATSASAATVDFESLPLGSQYGTPAGHAPGDFAFSENGVDMTVENFLSGAFVGFNVAEITNQPGPPQSFFPPAVNSTQALNTNNISGRFHFGGLGYDVQRLSVHYADAGGTNNFDVNGLGLQQVSDLTTLASYPNYNVSVTATPMAGGFYGRIDVEAAPGHQIHTLTLGGQEISFDNLRAVPEPAAAALGSLCLAGLCLVRRRRRE